MTQVLRPATAHAVPPFSSSLRVAAGVSLILAGALNGGLQYVGHLVSGGADTPDATLLAGAEHPGLFALEQVGATLSALFMLLGVLGIAQVTRWRYPRLTAVSSVLAIFGMWGMGNVMAMWFTAGTVARDALGLEAAVELNGSLADSPGTWAIALVPHLIGSFFGLLLLAAAARRDFPVPAVVLVVVFLLWDFLAPVAVGPLEPHLLFMVATVWLGVHLIRMPQARWLGHLH